MNLYFRPVFLVLISLLLFSLTCSAGSVNWCVKPDLQNRLQNFKLFLQQDFVAMRTEVANKVIQSLECARKNHTEHSNIVAVIDFSLPSNQKRLWVLDLDGPKLLYHTYVSHGITSGERETQFFSNTNNSKATSMGIFKSANDYYGRHGLSMRLNGLERNINNNALSRYIVMHGGWYVEEPFIQKYGRAGRSWGCPVIPSQLTRPIIDTVKDGALFVAYYPDEQWLAQSQYLNCKSYSPIPRGDEVRPTNVDLQEQRDAIVFIEKNNNNRHDSHEPIVVMAADDYWQFFNKPAPLKRMLRRQIQNEEYIALSHDEFLQILRISPELLTASSDSQTSKIIFVVPEVKQLRGYWATEFRVVAIGKINKVLPKPMGEGRENQFEYTMEIENKPNVHLKATTQFIRWLGL